MSTTAKPLVVACPICSHAVVWNVGNRWKPFCSERCKMIDLGQWATESYRVPAEEQESDDASSLPQ